MLNNLSVLLPILFPVLMGLCMFCLPLKRKGVKIWTTIGLLGTGLLVGNALLAPWSTGEGVTLFSLLDNLTVYFQVDSLGSLFVFVVTVVWILAGFFGFGYMEHEKNQKRYFAFYLMTFGVLIGLDFSGNLITLYLFYEFMTLISMPLVIHNGSREAIMAGLKYLFYSFAGAYMALFGLYFLYQYTDTLTFTAGGVGLAAGHDTLLLVCVFLMILGFGVKAGMFPLHAWLPTAHPVAPAPASSVLSAIIVKGGVLAMLRVIFYLVGPDFIEGTWVQYAFLTLTLITVFMGSMLAYREKGLKKRLAYSTVSQVSYILFGIAILQPTALTGSLLHVVFHAFIKSALFLVAGAIIVQTGRTRVDELTGIGKEMPVTMWCYTIVSLGLIGIPPTGGFVSKWYLAVGALDSGVRIFAYLGPVVLLISALLTAGYLLPITMKGFFPGEGYNYGSLVKKEPSACMTVPLVVLAALVVLLGIFTTPLLQWAEGIVAQLFV